MNRAIHRPLTRSKAQNPRFCAVFRWCGWLKSRPQRYDGLAAIGEVGRSGDHDTRAEHHLLLPPFCCRAGLRGRALVRSKTLSKRASRATTRRRCGCFARWPSKAMLSPSLISDLCTRPDRECREIRLTQPSGIDWLPNRGAPPPSTISAGCTPRARASHAMRSRP